MDPNKAGICGHRWYNARHEDINDLSETSMHSPGILRRECQIGLRTGKEVQEGDGIYTEF